MNIDAPLRNVDVDHARPVAQLHPEAIEAMLDRGSISDWRLLVEEIRRQPWGRLARLVDDIASRGEHYGVDQLMHRSCARAATPTPARAGGSRPGCERCATKRDSRCARSLSSRAHRNHGCRHTRTPESRRPPPCSAGSRPCCTITSIGTIPATDGEETSDRPRRIPRSRRGGHHPQRRFTVFGFPPGRLTCSGSGTCT